MESGEGIDGSRVERIAFSEMEDSEGGKRVMTLMSDTDRPSEVGEKDERARHRFGSERAVLLVFCHPVLDHLRRPVADGALETERETRHIEITRKSVSHGSNDCGVVGTALIRYASHQN